ncbi:WD and tetratricopeptide repeats protein 1-like [Tubulanus polymorphus]|uniref:WD and tetratricopeptide repeats protein 1-like n=1 Tax=Tubulanus polymorphus TaxID=672921 RepID=UPI003DA40D62
MTLFTNITKRLDERKSGKDFVSIGFQRDNHVTPDLVRRIGLEAELEGHKGCVNCLEWNEKGTLLASGSDDVNVIIWDPFRHKRLISIPTVHQGNIFSVKFLPNSNDNILVSGAADNKILVHDVSTKELTQVFSCHGGRVKRLATAPNVPFMFWSASEDGTIMQFDLRCPETCGPNPENVLVNLNAHMGVHAEAKCVAINPLRTEQLAVGANDPYIRLYDRRMLSCKSMKFPNDGNRSPWERQNLIAFFSDCDDFKLPDEAVNYYVAGHLPQKQTDYRRRYRTLASTYVTFSPDGNELLVNLGGEQIYLFDINKRLLPLKYDLASLEGLSRENGNGYSHRNGTTMNGTTNGVTNGVAKSLTAAVASLQHEEENKNSSKSIWKVNSKPLLPHVEAIKQRANQVFEKQQYTQAIILYNQAIALAPDSAILHGNRAAAYMKRGWDGDLYAALRDCYIAIRMDRNHLKAHFRLARCLFELQWTQEAADCLRYFKRRFPDYASNSVCETLDKDIRAAIFAKSEEDDTNSRGDASAYSQAWKTSEQEKVWRSKAFDYEQRFCGHCNTTTDIKEANFFGSKGQYIVAGSDDGSFFIWEKQTTNIVRVLRGDDSIVNCLQPHQSNCLLATSGIDPVVRLWSPRQEDGHVEERAIDNSDDAASANQRRMNADPLEVMLMNMGYRITGIMDDDDEDSRSEGPPCRPS